MKGYRFIAAVTALALCCAWGLAGAQTPAGDRVSDGPVTIEKRPQYYLVTLDFTTGQTHREVGAAYGRTIQKVYPEFESEIGSYLYQAATALLLWGDTLSDRVADLRPTLDQDYRDEIDGLASTLKGAATFSGEELAYIYNLMPDVLRTSQCAAFGVWGTRSALGTNIAFRTLDWYRLLTQPFPRIQAVTKLIYPGQTVYLIGGLGHLGVISAINPRTRIMTAILDATVEDAPYTSKGRRSYIFDLRHALEHASTTDEIATAMTAPTRDYAVGQLILLADTRSTRVIENNTALAGPAPRRALRTDTAELNPGIPWDHPELLGIVNAFMLKGQIDNFSQGLDADINQGRWNLLRNRIAAKLAAPSDTLSTTDVKEIMSAYWGAAPTTIYQSLTLSPTPGDLYNADTQQMMLYVPSTNHLEVFFRPKEGPVPNRPQFIEVRLD